MGLIGRYVVKSNSKNCILTIFTTLAEVHNIGTRSVFFIPSAPLSTHYELCLSETGGACGGVVGENILRLPNPQ